LNWAAGDNSPRFINIPITTDSLNEYDETFFVNLSAPTNATIGTAQATVTIIDDDLPTLSIADTSVVEGTGGTTTAFVFVTITGISSRPVSVNYATANNTATAPADYTAQSGTFTWSSGDTTDRVVTIPIVTDSISELDETFFVNLSGAVNATITDNQAVVTIINDDQPTLAVADLSIVEGTGGTTTAVVTVNMTGIINSPVSVEYNTADGTATSPADYTATSGTLNWPAADNSPRTINITINPDDIHELNETFRVNIFNATNATISDNQAVVTITNDDPVPVITINDITVDEGVGTAVFTVTLANPSYQNVSVNYATANGTATAPADYTATSGTLVIPAGSVTGNINVTVIDDAIDELDETFFVNLSAAVNGTIGDSQGIATILDNDGPDISIASVVNTSEIEPSVSVTVTLSATSVQAVTVIYSTANGSATAGTNYTAVINGTLTIPASSLTGNIQITLLCVNGGNPGDIYTFFVNLTSAINGFITGSQAQVNMADDGPGMNCP
jgi:hypothetical protein